MSLINEALKKAQRSRTVGTADEMPPLPGGGPVARRREVRSVNTIVLYGSAGVILVVLSVVATFYFVNRPAPAPAVAVVKPAPAVATGAMEPTPTIIVPSIPAAPAAKNTPVSAPPPAPAAGAPAKVASAKATPPTIAVNPPTPASTSAPEPAATPPATSPRPVAIVPAVTVPRPTSGPVVAPAPELTTPPAPPPVMLVPDERIAAFIEAMRISGVRASGADSRVLINDRVYRMNDIIERTLGIRLTEVAQGRLTFTDANGVTYVKHL